MTENIEFQEIIWGIAESPASAESALEARFISMIIRHFSSFPPATSPSLLDVPCGSGRHHEVLRQEGFRVFGIDEEPAFIAKARRLAGSSAADFYRVGDMRSIDYPEATFEVVLNFFGSFGYFSDQENRLVLRGLSSVLKSSGLLVVYSWTPSVQNMVGQYTFEALDETHFKLFESKFVDETWCVRISIMERRGDGLVEVLRRIANIRLYSKDEMASAAMDAGLDLLGAFSGLTIGQLRLYDPAMLLVFRKTS